MVIRGMVYDCYTDITTNRTMVHRRYGYLILQENSILGDGNGTGRTGPRAGPFAGAGTGERGIQDDFTGYDGDMMGFDT